MAAAMLGPSGWCWAGTPDSGVVTAAVYSADAAAADSAVRTVSYTTGKPGEKLTWLPFRPTKDDVKRQGLRLAGRDAAPSATPESRSPSGDRPEQFAQYTEPLPQTSPQGRAVDPFDDPFEDAKAALRPVFSGTRLQDQVLRGTDPQSMIPGSLPDIAGESPVSEASPESQQEPLRLFSEETLVVAPARPEEPCSAIHLRPISEVTYDISAKGDMFPPECPLDEGTLPERLTRGWAPITFTWKASALCHKPAYFEQVQLERYGHSAGPYLQPVISGAHFFLTVPVLPYKMGLYPPTECIYSLGYYRPGNCAPYMLDPLPISIRAGLFEAAAWTGMVYLMP
jgi:hypothetical protein